MKGMVRVCGALGIRTDRGRPLTRMTVTDGAGLSSQVQIAGLRARHHDAMRPADCAVRLGGRAASLTAERRRVPESSPHCQQALCAFCYDPRRN